MFSLFKMRYLLFLVIVLPSIIKDFRGTLLTLLLLLLAIAIGSFIDYLKKYK